MRSWVIFLMISFAVCATEHARVNPWERKIRAVQGQTPYEVQAAGDAATLVPLIRQIAELAQDYYINGTSSDLDQIDQIVTTDMQSAIADLQSIAAQIPNSRVEALFNVRERLKDPTLGIYVMMLTQLSGLLGRIYTMGSGPASLTPVDNQARNEGMTLQKLMILGMPHMKGLVLALQMYLKASDSDKGPFLVDIENVLATMQGHMTTLSGLSVSPAFQSKIAAMAATLPTDPTSSDLFAQVNDFNYHLGEFLGMYLQ